MAAVSQTGASPSIVWVNQYALLPRDGGGTRHFELGRELVRLGWSVTVLAADFHVHRREYSRRRDQRDRTTIVETVDGVELRWLWAAPYRRNDWRRAWNWLSFSRSVLREVGRLSRPDVVIGSSPQLFAAAAGRKLAAHFGSPFVFEVRDLWPEGLLAAGNRGGPAYWVLDRVASSLYRTADRTLVLTRGTGDYLAERRGVPREKIVCVPNGVDVGAITPGEGDRGSDKPPAELTLIYAGAHGPVNGLDRVLDAASILGEGAGVRFVLVGDGPVKDQLRTDASARGLRHVEFRDPVSKPELAGLLRESDAGLMVLRDSSFFSFAVSPNKLFDYFAAGLPVVCNVPGEVAAMVRAADGGVQASDASPESLAAAIRELQARSRETRARMGQSAREWVRQEHSREVLGRRLDEHLRPLVGS